MLVSPEMVSRTVQVRVRPPLPASTGPSSDTSVSTSREPGGTAVEYIHVHFYTHCGTSNEDPPATCISVVTVYTVAPVIALHVQLQSPVSHLSLEEWYTLPLSGL